MKRILSAAILLFPALTLALDIDAKSGIIMDLGTGKVLWEKDADTPRYPASTTKIMTSLLLLEHCLPTDVITAPADVTRVKESSMNLKPYEKVSAKDMLYAVMLRSANDGSYAVANHIAGSVPAFSKLMNERAKQIGCENTHFNNPNGLNDPLHMTTARDLALIGREAMKYDAFREVARTQKYKIKRSINQKDTLMVSRNKWLAKDPTASGIKTGYTRPAGLCYVGSAKRNGFEVITSLLKSENWQKDHEQMLHWTYKYYEKVEDLKAGDVVGEVKVTSGAESRVPVQIQQDAYAVARKGTTVERILNIDSVEAPIEKDQQIGTVTLRDSEGFEQVFPVVAAAEVELSTWAAIGKVATSGGGAGLAMGSLLFVGAFYVRGRSRKPTYGSNTKKTAI